MELSGYDIDESLYIDLKLFDVSKYQHGNGMWFQNNFYFDEGYGFGYTEDFTSHINEFIGNEDIYDSNLIFNI